MVIVKICGITTLEDALAAVEAGADALGFNFYRPSPRYVAPSEARKIIERLPREVLTVGVFVDEESPASVEAFAAESGVEAVQLHGDESREFCQALSAHRVIKALRAGPDFRPEHAAGYQTEAILLDSFSTRARGGTGLTFDWQLARATRELVPRLFLSGGLTAENVAEAVNTVGPFGLDACSGVETRPGRKSFERMRAFVAAAHGKM